MKPRPEPSRAGLFLGVELKDPTFSSYRPVAEVVTRSGSVAWAGASETENAGASAGAAAGNGVVSMVATPANTCVFELS